MTSIPQNWYIYGIRSEGNPYRYVGLTTTSPQARLNNHFSEANRHPEWPIYRWMAKQGRSSLYVDILEVCPASDKQFLFEAEKYWISFYQNLHGSLGNPKTEFYLLNVLEGGRCARLGVKHTEETKAKMRAAHAAHGPRKYNPERRRSGGMKGKEFTEEHRAKLSQAKIGNKQSHYALHVRHHVNKDKLKSTCQHCYPDLTLGQESSIIDLVGSQ